MGAMAGERPTQLLFIDDSGTKEYASDSSQYRPAGNTRYFVFGGVLLSDLEASRLAQTLQAIKVDTFGTPDVEIKSNWLRMPHERSRRYLTPFGLKDENLRSFSNRYYDTISSADLLLVAAVVDKPEMQRIYPTPWYAPAMAYEVLTQRIVQEVRLPQIVRTSFDNMSGATPAGNQFRTNLERHHSQLCKEGSRLVKGLNYGVLHPRLRFLDSARSDLIQVADLVAYNVYRQFVEHGEAWEDSNLRQLPTYEWFARLGHKFRHDGSGRVQGFGIVKAPLTQRVQWTLDPASIQKKGRT